MALFYLCYYSNVCHCSLKMLWCSFNVITCIITYLLCSQLGQFTEAPVPQWNIVVFSHVKHYHFLASFFLACIKKEMLWSCCLAWLLSSWQPRWTAHLHCARAWWGQSNHATNVGDRVEKVLGLNPWGPTARHNRVDSIGLDRPHSYGFLKHGSLYPTFWQTTSTVHYGC